MSKHDDPEQVMRGRSGRGPGWSLVLVAVMAILIVVAFLGGAVLQGALSVFGPAPRSERVTIGPSVVTAVRELSHLETVSFHMERVIEVTDKQWEVFGDLGIEDALLLVAAADVTAGVDLSQLEEGDIEVDPGTSVVRIRLPAPEVLSTRLDLDRTYVHRRDTDLLARHKDDLEGRARKLAVETLKKAALEGGILERARTSAEGTLGALLRSLGHPRVEFVWADR